ncbi:hypothetical protein B0O99DRAFT_287896 [Bisporella sp. PMI_857]|nr:hypothetical protein B0O99DRAFT_287896 [Bisporella sp. PMI_857]
MSARTVLYIRFAPLCAWIIVGFEACFLVFYVFCCEISSETGLLEFDAAWAGPVCREHCLKQGWKDVIYTPFRICMKTSAEKEEMGLLL